jgi:hypothetical protein
MSGAYTPVSVGKGSLQTSVRLPVVAIRLQVQLTRVSVPKSPPTEEWHDQTPTFVLLPAT